jgi:hypothetical protein
LVQGRPEGRLCFETGLTKLHDRRPEGRATKGEKTLFDF